MYVRIDDAGQSPVGPVCVRVLRHFSLSCFPCVLQKMRMSTVGCETVSGRTCVWAGRGGNPRKWHIPTYINTFIAQAGE